MSSGGVKVLLRAGSALGLLFLVSTQVQAGGFALREQSAYGQGVSFAGVAAGGALSSMYWNPAVMTQYYGKAMEADLSVIMPSASHSYTSSTLSGFGPLIPGYAQGVGNSGNSEVVPSSYASWQLSDRFWLGLSVNAPFGLSVAFPTAWAGAGYGQDSSVKSYNFSPSVAFKINEMLSVAVGFQAQYMQVGYKTLTVPATQQFANLGGTGWAYGFTVGATITPLPGTVIGVGYRSALNQKIDGTLSTSSALPATTTGSVNLTLNLPDILTVGLRQRITDRFTMMAGFEWSRWSRIGTAALHTDAGNATILGTAVTLPFQYSDGYFYSLGGEYIIDPSWTVRGGIAFEKSPITDGVRTPRLPDNDRMWYSAGLGYKPPQFRGVTVDLGYSFIDVKDTPINIGVGTGNPWTNATGTYVGSVSSHIHILSVGVRYQWDAPEVRKTALITK
ncbi:OmpP1/FadL family transporter [Microbacteriaceae bacterium K1510]|nr:OmpP1/FadL family transporter [Microbacteriaceae bacterium K1510]